MTKPPMPVNLELPESVPGNISTIDYFEGDNFYNRLHEVETIGREVVLTPPEVDPLLQLVDGELDQAWNGLMENLEILEQFNREQRMWHQSKAEA